MKNAQQRLNKATKSLRLLIEAADALVAEAKGAADAYCAEGDMKVSAELRAIESSLRMGAALLTEAYAKGRALEIASDEGVIAPQGGGKD